MLYYPINNNFCSASIHQKESKKTGKEIRCSIISQFVASQLDYSFLNLFFYAFHIEGNDTF